jgi:hypothetical protein
MSSTASPLSSPQGLNEVAQMLAGGTITARIRWTVELADVGQILEKLCNGGPQRQGRHPPLGRWQCSSVCRPFFGMGQQTRFRDQMARIIPVLPRLR